MKTVKAFLYVNKTGRPCKVDDLAVYKKINPKLYKFYKEYTSENLDRLKPKAYEEISYVMNEIEMALTENKYLVCDEFTLADLSWVVNVDFLEVMNYDLSKYPNIKQWLKRIKQRDVYSKIKYPFYMRIMFKTAVEIKRLFTKCI